MTQASDLPVMSVVLYSDEYDLSRIIWVKMTNGWAMFDSSADQIEGIKHPDFRYQDTTVQRYLDEEGTAEEIRVFVVLPSGSEV